MRVPGGRGMASLHFWVSSWLRAGWRRRTEHVQRGQRSSHISGGRGTIAPVLHSVSHIQHSLSFLSSLCLPLLTQTLSSTSLLLFLSFSLPFFPSFPLPLLLSLSLTLSARWGLWISSSADILCQNYDL